MYRERHAYIFWNCWSATNACWTTNNCNKSLCQVQNAREIMHTHTYYFDNCTSIPIRKFYKSHICCWKLENITNFSFSIWKIMDGMHALAFKMSQCRCVCVSHIRQYLNIYQTNISQVCADSVIVLLCIHNSNNRLTYSRMRKFCIRKSKWQRTRNFSIKH